MFAAINAMLSTIQIIGQQEYTTPGTYTFTVPEKVYSISVVAIVVTSLNNQTIKQVNVV